MASKIRVDEIEAAAPGVPIIVDEIETNLVQGKVNTDVVYRAQGTGIHRFEGRVQYTQGAEYVNELLYPKPFPSIYHERGYTPMTVDGPVNGKIKVVNGAVNTLNYTHWTGTWNYHYMNYITPMTKTYAQPNTATDNYAIIELPVVQGEHNALWVLGAANGWIEMAGWLLDPVTEFPVKLLSYDKSNSYSVSYSGATYFPGPDGEKDHPERYHYWMMFPVHRDDVAQYATVGGNIKIAVLPGVQNAYTYLHISGLASTTNPWAVRWIKGLHIGSWNPYGHINHFDNYGYHEEGYMAEVNANEQNNGFRLPVLNTENNIIVGGILHVSNHYSGNVEWTIAGTNHRYYESYGGIGHMAHYINSRLGANSTRTVSGFVIPASVVQDNVQTHADGWRYLEFNVWNRSPLIEYYHALYVEDVVN